MPAKDATPHLAPGADANADTGTPDPPSSRAPNPRRKRGPGIVTPHACTECRRKRAKASACDGKTPCSRCEAHNHMDCAYEAPLRQSKDALRAELGQLRRQEDAARQVLTALGRTEASGLVMMRLWTGHSVGDVSSWLDETTRGGASDARPPPPAHPDSSPGCPGRSSVLWPSGEPANTTRAAASWTRVTSDPDLVEYLLALYFCWEYPTFASLSKEHYLRDFRAGTARYCSALLTNALLALASRLSSRPEVRAGDAVPAGEHFFGECRRLYLGDTHHYRLTTVQALGIMAIREASCGHVSASEYYAGQCMCLALEMGLDRVRSLETADEEDRQHRT
ncbi:hypothetical protein E4U42_001760, partial [Claviceps africana]